VIVQLDSSSALTLNARFTVLIDPDRPRRGLILIRQQSLIDLQQAIKQDWP
jgi:hypothetical protein